ncbi:MAG: endonuclease/exonuclease/phosphatase family protein [Prevotella sp.]|nr:endonuclease/exonuclease/phosphatase family protein [Prevotella sp.]
METKRCLMLLVLLGSALVMSADDGTFSVASLNVDGLPQKILFFSVNSDGPGSEGTRQISSYLAKKQYDIIGVQEDFDYDEELCYQLTDAYYYGLWQGGIDIRAKHVLAPWSARFDTDGLRMFWRKEHAMDSEVAVEWNDGCGHTDHCWDEMVTKGFRHCEMTLRGGQRIVVYDMHMDASEEEDEISGADISDKRARWNQWRQLRDYVLERLDERPVVVMGDMNSLYGRDSVEAIFIRAVNATLQYQVQDAWVELQRQGVYPEIDTYDPQHPDTHGETLDKILYINPVEGRRLALQSFRVETDYVREDGRPLGDHWPVSATFAFTEASTVGADTWEPATPVAYYSADGRRQTAPQRGLNIVRLSNGQVRKVMVR